MNTQSNLSLVRLKRAKQTRYNPLSSITDPSQLTRKLDAFEVGYLKEAVNIWDSLEQRDDLVRSVVSKRKKAVGRQGWTVLIHESIPVGRRAEAQAHAAALEHFYTHLRCENALDRSERGGFKLLCRQMMDAIGKRFAVHEIVWRTAAPPNLNPTLLGGAGSPSLPSSAPSEPSLVEASLSSSPSVENSAFRAPTASSPHSAMPWLSSFPCVENSAMRIPQSAMLTATFRFVPLSFFENTTGQLRYLDSESAVSGVPLEPGAWMVTTGEGLMMATATAWMVKHIALNDWLLYAERNGRPIIRGTTAAAENSPEWKALESTVEDILKGNAVVHSSSDDVKVLDLAVGGNIPYPQLVDRIDRMLAALWRGADLSTMSRDRGYGASLQERETCALEEDDAELLTETLNEYVDKWVIRYLFGEDAQPLANVKVLVTPKECTTADLEIDQFLYTTGAPLGLHDLLTRYGRALPKPGEPVIQLNPNPNLTRNRSLNPNPRSSAKSAIKQSAMHAPTASSPHSAMEMSSPESSHHATGGLERNGSEDDNADAYKEQTREIQSLDISPSRESRPVRLNPNGIPAVSPGLRGTSYPGLTDKRSINPEGVAATAGLERNGFADNNPDAYKEQTLDITPLDIGPSDAPRRPYLQSEKNFQPNAASSPTFPSGEQSAIHSPTASRPHSALASPSLVPDSPPSSPLQQSAFRNPHSAILKSHAIRRWRAHIPFPAGTPEPDGSWRDECPCGNSAPCSEHPELKGRVRPYKPQHPEYQLGLKEFNVPYYEPTPEEIGCTREALDRSCDLFADNPKMKDPPDPRFDPFKKTKFIL